MKLRSSIQLCFLTLLMGVSTAIHAGNPDRAGSSGAQQLLINPWARSSGLSNANMSTITGIESSHLNVAGLAFLEKTELLFTNSQYLVGSDIQINSFGLGQRVGESSVLGITVSNMGFGDIMITTEDLPEGGIGTFSPANTIIGLSYAKEFSNSIYGGITVKMLSESISNVRAQGVAFDAGIQYVTGEQDQVHFGISLKNVGPSMSYTGDGLAVTGEINGGSVLTVEQRSALYELPSLVNIGFGYDFNLDEKNRITATAMFTSNSFTRDQFALGAEYAFNDIFIARAGYQWEDELTDEEARMTVFTGPSAGFTAQFPAGENETMIGLDYSYQTTFLFSGVHNIGLHIDL